MSFALEISIGVLLIATCVYCIMLNRKLRVLRDGQTELTATIARFDEASRRAEANLTVMQGAGAALNRDLAKTALKANGLIDELSVMVNAGDAVAGRIEGAVRDVRTVSARSKRLAS